MPQFLVVCFSLSDMASPNMASSEDRTCLRFVPSYFNVKESTSQHIFGTVNCDHDLEETMKIFTRCSMQSFVRWGDDASTKKTQERRIIWFDSSIHGENDTVIPGTVDRSQIRLCSHGGQPRARSMSKTKKDAQGLSEHGDIKKSRFLLQKSTKVGCQAKAHIRYLTLYKNFRMDSKSSKRKKMEKMDHLKALLKQENRVPGTTLITIKLPLAAAHDNHAVTAESGLSNRIHPSVRDKLYSLVGNGISSTTVMQRMLKQFVLTELCINDDCKPLPSDRSYYPSKKCITNHIWRAMNGGQRCDVDQDNLEQLILRWIKDDPTSKFFLRKCDQEVACQHSVLDDGCPRNSAFPIGLNETGDEEATAHEAEEPDSDPPTTSFLFVYQTREQQKLLARYGQMALMDATHKTKKYTFPVFLLLVRTNVSYLPVAVFVPEAETTANIKEALKIIREWNPEWNPDYLMLDYSDEEYQALESVFPTARKFLCAFHSEQAWQRWCGSQNGLSQAEQTHLLDLLRAVAHSTTSSTFTDALEGLTKSPIYRNNARVQHYLDKFWLSIPEVFMDEFAPIKIQRWRTIHKEQSFFVTIRTNNSVEALNNSLKNVYLKLVKKGTLSTILSVIICDFLPDLFMEYVEENYKSSSQHRQYNNILPLFFHNRPRAVLERFQQSHQSAEYCKPEDIETISDRCFKVKSEERNVMYQVDLGDDGRFPSCTCLSFRKTYLPCEHMFALFHNHFAAWCDVSSKYRDSPYLNLDSDVLSRACSDVVANPQRITAEDQIPGNVSECEDQDGDVDMTCVLPPHEPACSGLKFREMLKEIIELSYLCEDHAVLGTQYQAMNGVREALRAAIPHENGLPVHEISRRPSVASSGRSSSGRSSSTALLPAQRKRKKQQEKKPTDMKQIRLRDV